MKNIEKACVIAGYYERNKSDDELVKYYLEQNLNILDCVLLINDIKKEIDKIQDMQDEYGYKKQLEHGKQTQPKRFDVILGNDAILDAENMELSSISEFPEMTKNTLKLLSMTAYKYQLKYTTIILEEMLSKDHIWSDVTIH